MQYQIQNITHEPHDLDDDVIHFYFDVQFTMPEALFIKREFYSYSGLIISVISILPFTNMGRKPGEVLTAMVRVRRAL